MSAALLNAIHALQDEIGMLVKERQELVTKSEIYRQALRDIVHLFDDEDFPDEMDAILEIREIAERALG